MAETRTFASHAEAFTYACEQLDCSPGEGKPVLAIVLAVRGRMCCVKIANRDDATIPAGTLNELLARNDLTSVCFSAMLADNVPDLETGDLVTYATMPELAAAGKAMVAGTIVARVHPHYSSRTGWQTRPAEARHAATASSPAPESSL